MSTLVEDDVHALAAVHKALGDPVRLRILQLLPSKIEPGDEGCNVNRLSADLGIPQPTVSHHLKILRQAGVLRFRKACNNVYYYVDVKHLRRAWRLLSGEILQK